MTTIKKNFLLIEHGGNRKQFTLDVLLEQDINIFVATSTVPEWLSEYISVDRIIQTDTYNSVRLLSDIVTYFESRHIHLDAIGTFFEHTVVQTADVARVLGLVGIDPGAARRSSSNKLLMRTTCRDAGIPTPRFSVIPELSPEFLDNAVSAVGVPCVIKPIFGSESYGVVKIEEGYEPETIISEITGNTGAAKKEVFKNFTGAFLIEEYLPGPVISVDGIVADGKVHCVGIVEFIMGPEPRFTQEANFIPARLKAETASEAEAMATKIVTALGFDHTGFHCEMRLTPDRGPVLLEVAARLPGGPLQPGHLKATGINMTRELVNVWLGNPVHLTPSHTRHILQKAVFPRVEGTIKHIDIPADLRDHDALWDLTLLAQEGDAIVTYPNIPKPLYYYAVHATTPEDLEIVSAHIEMSIIITLN